MATGDEHVSIQPKRLLGFLDFRERLLDYFKKVFSDITENAFGQNGFFNTGVTMSAPAADQIQLDNDVMGTDAQGHFLITNDDLAGRTSGIPVENLNTVTYYVANVYAERPRGVQINPRTGFPEFIKLQETIGFRDVPDAVVDNGDGTMTFTVNSVARPFAADVSNSHDQTGRTVVVWKKSPGKSAVTEALAVLEGTVFLDSGDNKVTVGSVGVDPFGQTAGAASTLASDYFVMLLGPTVSREDLSVQAFTLFIGTFVGTGSGNPPGTFDFTGQNILGPVAADLGQITRMHHGNLAVRVIGDASDVDEKLLEVQDSTFTPKWFVDEDGDMTVEGVSTFNGDAIFNGAATFDNLVVNNLTGLGGATVAGKTLKTYGATEIGNDETDAHTLFGDLTLQDNALTPNLVLDGQFGLVNVRQAAGSASLRTASTSDLQGQVDVGDVANGGTAFQASRLARIDFGDMNSLSLVNQLMQFTGFSGEFVSPTTRLFADRNGEGFWITMNANFDGGNSTPWFKDLSNELAVAIQVRGGFGTTGDIFIYTHNPGSTTAWAFGAWDNTVLHLSLEEPEFQTLPDIDTTLNLVDGSQLALNGSGGELLILQPPGGVGAIFQTGGTSSADWESTTPGMPVIIDGDFISNSGSVDADQDITAQNGNIDATLGNVTAGGLMSAGTTMTAGGNITSTAGNVDATAGDVTAGANMEAGGYVQATSDFQYAAAKTRYRWSPAPPGGLEEATPGDNTGVIVQTTPLVRLDDAGGVGEIYMPIELPDGVTLTSIDLLYDAAASGRAIMFAYKIDNSQVVTALRSTASLSLPANSPPTLVNYNSSPFLSEVIDNQNFRYFVRISYFVFGDPIDIIATRVTYEETVLAS